MLIDDTLGSLDDESIERVIDVFNSDLGSTTVIHIGRAGEAHDALFTRTLHLVKGTPELALAHDKKAAASVAGSDRR